MLNLHICLLVTIRSITDLNMVWEITDSRIDSFPQRGSDQNQAIGFRHLFSYYYQAYRNCITLRWLSNKYALPYQFYQVDSVPTLQMKELRLRKFKQFGKIIHLRSDSLNSHTGMCDFKVQILSKNLSPLCSQ